MTEHSETEEEDDQASGEVEFESPVELVCPAVPMIGETHAFPLLK